jgi:hypothetical protein
LERPGPLIPFFNSSISLWMAIKISILSISLRLGSKWTKDYRIGVNQKMTGL